VTISDATAGTTIYYTTNGTAPTTSSAVYSSAITVSATETLEAIAVKTGYTNSPVATVAYTINQVLPVPTFSVAAGTYTTSQTVSISDATAGTTIYYTTNGTAPTTSSSVYSSAITVSATETLEAIAVKTGYTNSPVATVAYTINQVLPVPTFSVAAGTYTTPQTVTISDATAGTTIYYTTNGTAPTTSSAVYSSAITVSANETLEAIAVELGYTNSAVASAAYTIAPVLPTPTFSPDTGIFTTSQTVTISNATAGTTIHYTMDGTTPTSSSTVYTGPITVTATTTLQAIAAKTGYTNSPVATSICTINPLLPSPTFSAAAGTYTTSQTVSISEATAGTTIYYTTNGTAPTTSSAVYTGPITVSATETIEAMAVEMCYTNSPVAMAAYTINPVLPAPAFSIAAGTYTTFQTVTVSDATAGTTIYFTTNGVAPTTASTKYSGAVTVSTTETMEAIAVETGYTNSSVASAAYTINAGLPVPSFSVAAGTYTTSQTVSISDATAGTTIYYTTNGTAPTASSSVYSGPITVNATETLEAIAVETGYWTSSVAKAAYTIDQVLPAPAFSVAAGTYTTSQTVTISDATVGATIYYTTNGTAPTTSSSVYNGPITVSATETIEAIAVETGYTTSPVSTGAYTITGSTTTNVAEDFTITPSGTSATVAPGGSVTYALTVTPLSPATTFPAEISLSANGLPSGATYSFSPAAVAEGAGATAVTLTVQLPQNASAKQPAGGIRSLFVPRMAPLALGLLLLPFSGRLRRAGKKMGRAMPAMLLLASATLAVIGLGGCGSTNAMIAPTQQSYTVAVIGTAGSVSKTTTVTLIVMQ
jgi:LysM repeat protein